MALFLVQHGQNLPRETDPQKGLSQEGRAEVLRIADVARNYGIAVARIEHSGKKRALQTAEIMAAALAPPEGVHPRKGINPLDDVVAAARGLTNADNLMLVGHLPFMERLAAYLITESVAPRVLKFQNGGIVCLEQNPDDRAWFIKWTLMPRIG